MRFYLNLTSITLAMIYSQYLISELYQYSEACSAYCLHLSRINDLCLYGFMCIQMKYTRMDWVMG